MDCKDCRLLGLATRTPEHELDQGVVSAAAMAHFEGMLGSRERLAAVFDNAGIATRQSCMPLDWYLDAHGWEERNALFLDHAERLLADAATAAIAEAGVEAATIDAVVTVTSTGIATPGLEARLMLTLGLRDDVERTPLFGLGCAGGVTGLARARQLAEVGGGRTVLLLVVELCTLTFRAGERSKSNLIGSALFGDGAAAAVIGPGRTTADKKAVPASGPVAPRIVAGAEHTWPGTLGVMGWRVRDDSLGVIFSRDIPDMIRRDLAPVVDRFLLDQGLSRADIATPVCHPGGAKVLDAMEGVFDTGSPGSGRGALALSHAVLKDHGNMSAPTVLFVLDRALRDGRVGTMLLVALGPGFTVSLALIDR